jgi:hypothetical protein
MEIEYRHLAPYIIHGVTVQYIGIINGAEIKAYDKIKPEYFDDHEAIKQYYDNYPKQIEGIKYGKLKQVTVNKNYVEWKVGKYNGHLKGIACNNIRMVLRPMDDLTKEIIIGKKKFVPLTELLRESNFDVDNMSWEDQLSYLNVFTFDAGSLSLRDAELLCSWHFDIFGLIDHGLAVNMHTVTLK